MTDKYDRPRFRQLEERWRPIGSTIPACGPRETDHWAASVMDEAWRLEQELWEAVSSGAAGQFYARHMTADGFIVLPGSIIERHELIMKWEAHEPLREYKLFEPRLALVGGDSVLVSYRVTADGEWLPNYRAQITALYTWSGGEWALAFRQHTPDGDKPFPF